MDKKDYNTNDIKPMHILIIYIMYNNYIYK